ncbi:hypothetical protein OF83DRAFT_1161476 [Amylostereum chailletii]|nr:hypothetical protein OF83DRAFT_1161476 [Amylostereum chailletii]
MLGTRTKQVFSYGRRNQRIVNVSENNSRHNDENTADQTPVKSATVARLRKDIHSAASTVDSPPPKPALRRARKAVPVSPSSSPAYSSRPKRVRQIAGAHIRSPNRKTSSATHRQPFGTASPNIPKSLALAAKSKKTYKLPGAKGTPLKPPLSPVVNVDIIVFDDTGRRLSQERRISHTNVHVNSIGSKPLGRPNFATDSEDEVPRAPKPGKRKAPRAKVIVLSSDESEVDETAPSSSIHSAPSEPTTYRLVPGHHDYHLASHTPPPPEKCLPTAQSPSPFQRPFCDDIVAQIIPYGNVAEPIPLPPINPRSRPRQLTPIRYRRTAFPLPPSPASPLSIADFDLSIDFSGLDITSSPLLPETTTPIAPHLTPLLQECGQTAPHEFSAFIESFPFDPIVRSGNGNGAGSVSFQKIGEASYSEVFGIGDVVLKVIPIRDEASDSAASAQDVETPSPSDAKDVLKEMIVTRAMGEMSEGFIKLLRTYVVRGRYPSLLLSLWDDYNDKKGSESIRPDMFLVSQVYAIIVLPNGGPDLEAYTFANASKTGWHQASSLFWQVARALAEAESLVSFEHRDLHWGQILVKNVSSSTAVRHRSKMRLPMDDPTNGVKATIIDLGLARMDPGNDSDDRGVCWTPFDEEVFEGEGDYQFDIYRLMRTHNGDEWETFRPLTNVMWLHYLSRKLLKFKRLRAPITRKPASIPTSSEYTERECYDSLVEMQEVLSRSLDVGKKPSSQKARRKTQAAVGPFPRSAGEVMGYGENKGWVRSA